MRCGSYCATSLLYSCPAVLPWPETTCQQLWAFGHQTHFSGSTPLHLVITHTHPNTTSCATAYTLLHSIRFERHRTASAYWERPLFILKNPKIIISLFLMKVSRHSSIFNGPYHRSVGLSHHKLTVKGAEVAFCGMCICIRGQHLCVNLAVLIKLVVGQQANNG